MITDGVAGWADLGNPVRVIETLIGDRIVPSWLRKMRASGHVSIVDSINHIRFADPDCTVLSKEPY